MTFGVKFVACASLVVLTTIANPIISSAIAGDECSALRAKYQSGMNSLVAQVRAKSPSLLMQYVSSLDSMKSTHVPSHGEAMRALKSVKPACMRALGEATCNQLIGSATSFINRSTSLNASFKARHCPGGLAG